MREIKLSYFNLFTSLRDLLYNFWVVILAAVIGFSSCQIYYSAFVVKKYTSSMTIAVNLSGYTKNSTVASMTRTIDIATSFTNVLQSDALVEIVEEKMGEKIGTVTATQKTETNLVDIGVTDTSPERAYNALLAVYANYHVITDSAFSNIIVTIVENPTMPNSISNETKKFNDSLYWALVAVAVSVLLIIVISYFRDTVKNVSDVDALLEGKLFGHIRHINKKKAKISIVSDGLLLTNPLIPFAFANSFRAMAIKLESLQRTKKVKSVVLTSIAENEGKTTISVNLAIALAEEGKKVLLVDTDFKLPAVYKFFDKDEVKPECEFGEYLAGKTDYDSIIRYDKKTNVYLACGKNQYRNSSDIVSGEKFRNVLRKFEDEFDFVIIDTPPGGLAVDAEILSEQASSMIFIVRQDCATVEAVNDYLSNISSAKLLGCVLNDVHYVKSSKRQEFDFGLSE